MSTRRCCKCHNDKPISQFHKDKTRKDGYYPQCKTCRISYGQTREPSSMRVCRRCQYTKPATDFHRDRQRSDGLSPYCKGCVKAYQKANAETQDKYGHDWQVANADKVRKYSREWAKRNPQKVAVNRSRRLAREQGAEGSYTAAEWRALCDWYDNTCLACGKLGVTIDHVIPITKGGANTLANLQPLCHSCNASKKNKTIDYRDPHSIAVFFAVYYGIGNS